MKDATALRGWSGGTSDHSLVVEAGYVKVKNKLRRVMRDKKGGSV